MLAIPAVTFSYRVSDKIFVRHIAYSDSKRKQKWQPTHRRRFRHALPA